MMVPQFHTLSLLVRNSHMSSRSIAALFHSILVNFDTHMSVSVELGQTHLVETQGG